MPKITPKDLFTINLDALHIQLNHSLPVSLDLTRLQPSTALPVYKLGATTLTLLSDGTCNPAYHMCYSVSVNSKKIGTIDVNPIRATYAANLIQFRTDNQLLYSTDLLSLIRQFMSDTNLLFHNYSKLDIAVDTTSDLMTRFEEYFFNSDKYHFHRNKSQIESLNTFGTIYRNGETNYTIYLAKNKTGRSMKLYNKSIEIDESSKKHYISDYHAANGLPSNKDVWRLELSITNNAIKKYETVYRLKTDYNSVINYYKYSKLDHVEKNLYTAEGTHKDVEPVFSRLQDSSHLLELFKHYSEGLAEFRKKDNNNITRCTRIPLINLPDNINQLKANEYIITTNTREVNTMKHNIKFQFEEFQKYNDIDYLTMAQKIATRNNLLDYYESLYSKYKSVISAYNHSTSNFKDNTSSLF